MSEGRRSQVVLLDERRLDIIIQSRLYTGELLDIVASHFSIKEKEYFGIAYIDDAGLLSWLQLTKRVLENDFPKKFSAPGAVLIFYLRVKYFVESITQLHDSATIEAYYLQAKSLVAKGELQIDSEIVFQLGALAIQATFGDFLDEPTLKVHLKRLPVLPASTLKEYPSIAVCESKVLEHYKSLIGQTRGEAIVNYLSILESLPAYGQHYYEVKDKSGNSCWLTLSYRGICQYDKNDRTVPKRVFLWKQLENLYYRDKKFTIEVHEARRIVHTLSSFNLYEDAIEEPVEDFDDLSSAISDPTTQVSVSRRALAPANVTVYVWYAASPTIAKCIWSMAIAQHGFFIDRSHKKSQSRSGVIRSLSLIATELCRSAQSLSSASSLSNISRSTSSASIPTIVIEGEISEESKAATIEMLTALQSRKDALQEALNKKTQELKTLCLKEGELIGELPPETPYQPGEPQPQVRRRIGTSFTLSDRIIYGLRSKNRETENDLELDYEIQSKIASAAFKLANEVSARKSVRKLRKISYQQATNKLKDIEQKLSTLKREKEAKKKSQDSSSEGTPADHRCNNHLGLPASSSENSLADRNGNVSLSIGNVPPSTSLPQLSETVCSAPPSPSKCRQRHQSLQHVPVITTEVYEDVGLPYNPPTRRNSSSYSAASEYDAVSYNGSGIGSLNVLYRNRFEANIDLDGTNHYSVPNRRASQAFNDPDELLEENSNAVSQCCVKNVPSTLYGNSASLSSSYDERLFHKGDGYALATESISIADSFDKSSIGSNSILSFGDSNYQLATNCDTIKQEKYLHAHSENSLHRQRANSLHRKLEHLHISEPELNLNPAQCEANNSHRYIPVMRNTLRPTSTILPANTSDYSSGVSNQSINQASELPQTAGLLHDGKRSATSGCLEYSSPKSKTKEWIETSLDSPIVNRKRKPKQSDSSSTSDQCHQIHWLDNGLPTTHPNESYFAYQNPSNYMSENASSINIKYQSSPSPVQHQYTPADCSVDYRNPKVAYSSQLSTERIYANSNHLAQDNVYRHYENTAEISRNPTKFSPLQSNPCFDIAHRNYNPNYKNIAPVDEPNCQQHLIGYQEAPVAKLGVAEPQQPSKHQNRRINMGDVFQPDNLSDIDILDYQSIPTDLEIQQQSKHQDRIMIMGDVYPPDNLPCINVPDYQNIPTDNELQQPSKHQDRRVNVGDIYTISNSPCVSVPDYQNIPADNELQQQSKLQDRRLNRSDVFPQKNVSCVSVPDYQNIPVDTQYEPVNFRDTSSPYAQVQCDVPDSNHYSHNHPHKESLHHDSFNSSTDSLQVQTWQQPVTSVPAENAPVSPVSQNMNFSPTVEVNVVSVGHFQPYWEETKPYELSDFYKYSTKHRKHQKNLNKSDAFDFQPAAVDNNSEINHQYYEKSPRGSVDVMYREYHYANDASNIATPPKQHQEVVTSHVPVFGCSEQLESPAQYYADNSISSPSQQSDPDKSLSLGEVGLRISLADTFHEEMVAWYQNQDTVKKATLV